MSRSIFYSLRKKPNDRITKLQARIASGEVKLKWDEQFGWLPALLDAPQIPEIKR